VPREVALGVSSRGRGGTGALTLDAPGEFLAAALGRGAAFTRAEVPGLGFALVVLRGLDRFGWLGAALGAAAIGVTDASVIEGSAAV
jgi:hypothetical protein